MVFYTVPGKWTIVIDNYKTCKQFKMWEHWWWLWTQHKLHGLEINLLNFNDGFCESRNPFQNIFRNLSLYTKTNTFHQIVD